MNHQNPNMSYKFIIYADSKYYSLKYSPTLEGTGTTYELAEICDTTNKLYNIVPKAVRTINNEYCIPNTHCIVDVDNNLHVMILTDDNIVENLYMKICKVKSVNFKIIGFKTESYEGNHYWRILLRNDSGSEIHEFIEVSCIQQRINVDCHTLLTGKTVVYGTENIKVRLTWRKTLEYFNVSSLSNTICGLDVNTMKNLDNIKLFKNIANSVLIFNGRHEIIIKYNHIHIRLDNTKFIDCKLPVENIQCVINYRNIEWSRQTHNLMSTKCKKLITSIVVYNRLLGNLKMPYGVLQLVVNMAIN